MKHIMKSLKFFALVLIGLFILVACASPVPRISESIIDQSVKPQNTISVEQDPLISVPQEQATEVIPSIDIIEPSPTPSVTPTPDPFSQLYNCEMEISFTSGPLENKSADFSVLGKDYFLDKADKFAPGKGTGIFYESQRYFIIHSSYINGNILRPMEGEFLRKYLEYWGGTGNQYIQGQIDSLIGSQAIWRCDGDETFQTSIDGIMRLSHEASDRLWLNPQDLQQIISDKEGEESEWVGELPASPGEVLYLSFCGWGPESLGNERYTHYRYLLQFTVVP
jgi:hypothetical protein